MEHWYLLLAAILPAKLINSAREDSELSQDAARATATKLSITNGIDLEFGAASDLITANTTPGSGNAGDVLKSLGAGAGWEWGTAPASYTAWNLAGDTGTPQTISDGNTATVEGSLEGVGLAGIATVAGATDKVTVSLVNNGGTASASTFYRGDGQWAAAGGGSRKVDTGTGDGTTVDFTMTQAFTSVDYVDVYISGVYQQKSTYTQPNGTGTTLLRFTTAPPVTASNGIDFVINY